MPKPRPEPVPEPVVRPTRKRSLKREALLVRATELFNLKGIGATSIGDVAAELGLTRAALYYYVEDRDALVFQCYLRACEQTAEDLALAAEANDGLSRVLDFVERQAEPSRPAAAVLSETRALPPAQREVVEAAQARNAALLQAMVAGGVADGSIRPCDAEIVAQAILGMLAWAQLSPHWVRSVGGRSFRARTARALTAMLHHGDGAPGRPAPACPVAIESFLPGPINAFDRREAAEMKTTQLIAAASQLFNRHGIEATSLEDVSAALGATKGVVYHYMQDKTDLVIRCYQRAFSLYDAFALAARRHGADGHARAMIGAHLNVQAQVSALSPLMPQPGLDALPEPHRSELTVRARGLRTRFAGFIRQAIADGSGRDCDVLVLSQIGAGAFGWLPKWVAPDDPRPPARFGDEIVALFTFGLSARRS
ncbi:MAG: TetR family transcriptional regulator [Caulobacteraceae bacterium]|nr:TetR family transcriptional regulator [Caulobacteraceae bacterium]